MKIEQILKMDKQQAETEIPFGHRQPCGCYSFALWQTKGEHSVCGGSVMTIQSCVEYIEIANARQLSDEMRQKALGFVAEWFPNQPIEIQSKIKDIVAMRYWAKFEKQLEGLNQ